MTLASAFWPRKFPKLPASVRREFDVEPGSRILAKCHWQREPQLHPTLVLLHGLEGSSESGYMLGAADKAFRAGFNVLRVNQRNCGGTANLTPTLYNSGLSGDMRAVVNELIDRDGLPEVTCRIVGTTRENGSSVHEFLWSGRTKVRANVGR